MAKTGWVWDGTQFVALTAPVGAFPNAVGNYSSTAPTSPKTGQVWYDTSTGFLKIYSGSTWNAVGVPYASTAPTSPATGMLWVDSSVVNAPALKVYDGSSWISVSSAPDSDQGIIANQVFR